MPKRVQEYRADAITVTFDPTVCIHSEVCIKSLPGVFDVSRRAWIQPDQASADAIAQTIRQCPSGALQYRMADAPADPAPTPAVEWPSRGGEAMQCTLNRNGSIKVEGPIRIVTETGEVIEKDGPVFLCRCGGSARKPFCDGTHKRNGFVSVEE